MIEKRVRDKKPRFDVSGRCHEHFFKIVSEMLDKNLISRPNCSDIEIFCKENRLRLTITPENLSQWTSSRNHLPETVDTKIYNLCSQKGRLPNFAFEEPISKEFFDNTMVAKELVVRAVKVKHGKLENQIAENKRIDEEQKAKILK